MNNDVDLNQFYCVLVFVVMTIDPLPLFIVMVVYPLPLHVFHVFRL